MTTFIHAVTILLLPLGLGYSLVHCLTRRTPLSTPLSIAVGYGLGTGLLTQWMLLLGILHIPFTARTINIPLLLLIPFFLYLSKKPLKDLFPLSFKQMNSCPKLGLLSMLMLFYISIYVMYVFWRSFNVPISSWDAFSVYALQAKVFFWEQSLKYHPNLPHYEYPLHTPFLQTWIALNFGEWNDQTIKSFFSFYFIFYLIIQYSFIRTFTSRQWALLSLVLLLSSNLYVFHSTIAYRDGTMLYYNCTSIILLSLWQKNKDNNMLILASLFAGMMTFNKLDGVAYLFIMNLLVFFILSQDKTILFKKKILNFIQFNALSSSILLIYQIYWIRTVLPRVMTHAKNDLDLNINVYQIKFQFATEHFMKFLNVFSRIAENLFFSNNWNIVWIILCISLLNIKKKNFTDEMRLFVLALILSFGIFLTGYTFTQHYYWAVSTDTVVSRGILHIYPLATILIILINFPNAIDRPPKP